MKKLIAILLAVLMVACFAACGATEDPTNPATDGNVADLATDGNATEGDVIADEITDGNVVEDTDAVVEDEIVADDSAAVAALSAVWNEVVADEALIAAFGAASAEELASYFMGPVALDMSDVETVSYALQLSVDSLADVTEVAHIGHMNANNLTAAAYVLAEGTDVTAFAETIKNDIADTQWMCGFPEQLIIAEAEGVVIAAFGGADVINAFNTVLSANGTVLVNDMIG